MVEVTRGIHLLADETKGSFVYLIMGDEPVLVDTGIRGRANRIIGALERMGMGPSDVAHIVLTHQDFDHIGNARALQEWSGAALWAPETEIPYIHGDKKGPGIRHVFQRLMRVDNPIGVQPYQAGKQIGNLEVIPAPGHTPGHVCLRTGDVLMAGDLVMTRKGRLQPAPSFLTWDKSVLQESLREVGRLEFDWVCPAHGMPVRRGSLWEAMNV
jgi:glyoxylase-like metal-dependent hydrolase (beta-lactamase superfamily II)